ncbi:MAG: hypothetical protein K940chlam2_00707 [Chlamydiae bacterium]|nr:hypothetical protein [Chlamydiota bacterium]
MTRSMTGYGRGESPAFEGARWVVEIHTVNRKLLDIAVQLPREWLKFDLDLRKGISQAVKRGQITVKAFFRSENSGIQFSKAYCQALAKAKEGWEETSLSLGLDPKTIDLSFLVGHTHDSDLSLDEEAIKSSLKAAFTQALSELLSMRENEGELIGRDLKERFDGLERFVAKAGSLMEGAPDKYREKLIERIKEVVQDTEVDERILKEVALYAERVDVSEEVTRLNAHIHQARELLEKKGQPIGRTLDFLMQEILRELNTLGSKTPLLEVIRGVIEAKTELEKIREQVQNIE